MGQGASGQGPRPMVGSKRGGLAELAVPFDCDRIGALRTIVEDAHMGICHMIC